MEESELKQEMLGYPIEKERYVTPGISGLARQAAAEGCVVLKNDGVLPLAPGQRISVFGRCQINTFLIGYGSGGDIHPPYQITISDGLKACEKISLNTKLLQIYEDWCGKNVPESGTWGNWPMHYPEMPLDEQLVKEAAQYGETAFIVLGRAAGEERENVLEKGSYYLTDEEEQLLQMVTKEFAKTIVILDCGNIIDMSFVQRYPISAIVCPWLGGMEAGNALADVLCGDVNPSGKLPDTIAKTYEDYPSATNFGGLDFNNYEEDIFVGYRYFETFAKDRLLYPFGFGLSYTSFQTSLMRINTNQDGVEFVVRVSNVGETAGKEVIQIYMEAPQGVLGKEAKRLVAFQKTEELKPLASAEYTLRCSYYEMSSYDEYGRTGYSSSYVMEPGSYYFYLGVNEAGVTKEAAAELQFEELKVLERLEAICPVKNSFRRIKPVGNKKLDGTYEKEYEMVEEGAPVLKERILSRLPKEYPATKDRNLPLDFVASGKATMEEFIAQLEDADLAALSNGAGMMNSPFGTEGNTGIFGGITESLRSRGVPPIVTSDGPAGIRLKRYTSLLPCGMTLASTWNTQLAEELFVCVGKECRHFKIDVLLSPGLNIHRNPLCGRNFEYYSEDPMLSGKMAAAAVRGIQTHGSSACPKHFAANNQEVRRNHNDSRMSERALREIYLKGFEYCVKEAEPRNLMTSYNKINGVWSHYNYDLVTTVLRGEWNYAGNVMTDWWMRPSNSPEFPNMRDNAYRVRAQVDVLMPGSATFQDQEKGYADDGTLLETLGKTEGITRGELLRTAENVLRFAVFLIKNRE